VRCRCTLREGSDYRKKGDSAGDEAGWWSRKDENKSRFIFIVCENP
jgi:hypothetical protein